MVVESEIEKIKNHHWDYVIVGTGIGGSVLGLKLSEAGHSVLFIEKGQNPSDSGSLKGKFAEAYAGQDRSKILSAAGRSNIKFKDHSKKKTKYFESFLGSGVGGSSAIYGMALQRFKPIDFESWPISYLQFCEYYDEAESIFKVKKSEFYRNSDLLKLSHFLRNSELNPYVLPLANDDIKDCKQCQSFLCDHACKNDAGKVAVQPAIEKYSAGLLSNCEVLKVETTNNIATGVLIKWKNKEISLKAKNVVLAAGALFSPLILLDSKNAKHPNGLGNNSDLVGRNLMRHYVDLYALKIDSDSKNLRVKELAFDDYYHIDGKKLGTVQSFGRLPPVDVILTELKMNNSLLKAFEPIIRFVLKKVLSNRLVITSIVEDSAQKENRVWKDGNTICLNYEISKEDKVKISYLRGKLKRLFSPFGNMMIKRAENNEMLAHACGTCRMGHDPKESVVDLNNKVHGVDNLYVVDSSFFPTSGGTNPALTIAANALRVADLILQKRSTQQDEFSV